MRPATDPVHRLLLVLGSAWAAGAAAWASQGGGASPMAAAFAGGLGVLALGGMALLRSHLREQRARREALEQARAMLQDRLSDHLHLLLRSAAAPTRTLDERERARLGQVVAAAREVESALELLSEASIRAWEQEQVARGAADGTEPPSPPRGT